MLKQLEYHYKFGENKLINIMDTDRYIKIREELEELKGMIRDVNYQMQELRDSIRGAPNENKVLQMREFYEHPWWKYHGKRSNVS